MKPRKDKRRSPLVPNVKRAGSRPKSGYAVEGTRLGPRRPRAGYDVLGKLDTIKKRAKSRGR